MKFTAEFILLWFGWLPVVGNRGPAMLLTTGTALQRGRSSAGMVFPGILTRNASWGRAAALGLTAVMLAHAWIFEAIRYCGAGYLFWLARKALRSGVKPRKPNSAAVVSGSAKTLIAKGVALHITNPKAVLGLGAIFAIVAPRDAEVSELLTYFGVLYTGFILTFISYACLFSTPWIAQGYRRAGRRQVMGFAQPAGT